MSELGPATGLHIRLPENPSTGYRWNPDRAPLSTNWYPNYPPEEIRIGGGGYREFIWDDTVDSVILTYGRPWDSEPIERIFISRKTQEGEQK